MPSEVRARRESRAAPPRPRRRRHPRARRAAEPPRHRRASRTGLLRRSGSSRAVYPASANLTIRALPVARFTLRSRRSGRCGQVALELARGVGGLERAADQEALDELAAEAAQERELLLGLHPFGDDF